MKPISPVKDLYLTLRGVQTYFTMLKRSAYWSPEKMADYQYRHLRNRLIEAGEAVPYYQELFASLGFDPKIDFKHRDDLSKLPILSKQEVRENPQAFQNPKYVGDALTFRTSGSTGQPLEVYLSPEHWIMEQACIWRHWAWSGYRFRDPLAMVRSYAPKSGEPLWKTDKIRNFTYFSPFHLNDEVMGQYLDEMIRQGIRVLRGYPSSVRTLAEFVLRTGHAIPELRIILTASEALTDDDRLVMQAAFKIPVTNHYGLVEGVALMGDCGHHEGLHIYAEHTYVELLPAEDGSGLQVIGTALLNRAMPLIRYDTGDMAEPANRNVCGCGRQALPVVRNIIGRKDSHILTPEGYKIPTVNFYTMLEHFLEAKRWQIVQYATDHVGFILHTDQPMEESRIRELEEQARRRLPESVRVTVHPNQPFVQKYEGKITPFVSML